jgi:hypothetical protein
VAYSVSRADVVARWRPLSTEEQGVCDTLIADAVLLLNTARPSLAQAVTDGDVPDQLVTICVAEAVIRVLGNPDLLSNQSVSADGGVSQGFQFAPTTPRPRMRLSLLDLVPIDTALAAAGLGTGVTGSLRAVNSTPWTRWAGYYGGPLDISDVAAASTTLPTP